MTSRSRNNSSSSIDVYKIRSRTCSGECKRNNSTSSRTLSIGSIDSIIMDYDLGYELGDEIGDVTESYNYEIKNINKTEKMFINKEIKTRKRDVYYDMYNKDNRYNEPSPKPSSYLELMLSTGGWIKSSKNEK